MTASPPSGPVLVLGASGFLGPHALAALAAAGPVVAASRDPAVEPLLERLGAGAAARAVRPVAVDLEEPEALAALLDELQPRAIVNAAALSRIDACEREPLRARRLNALVPRELAAWSARRGARLVHVSTDLVFGGLAPPGGYDEDAPAEPASLYGVSKAEGEVHVARGDPRALVARLPLLYGDSAGRGLGASDAVLAALDRGRRPRLFLDEWRTPLSVRNAGAALAELVGVDLAGLLHVGGPRRLSRFELGLEVLRAAGVERPEEALEPCARADAGMADRPPDVSLDSSRARSALRTPLRAPEDELGEPSDGGAARP